MACPSDGNHSGDGCPLTVTSCVSRTPPPLWLRDALGVIQVKSLLVVVGVHAGVQRLVREAVEDGRLPRLAGRHCGGCEWVAWAGGEAGVWLEGAFPPRRPPVVRPATAECGGGGSLLQEKRAGWTPPSWDAPGLARNQVRNASNKCKYGQMGQPAGRQTCFCQARCQTNEGGDHNQTVLFSPPCRIPPPQVDW